MSTLVKQWRRWISIWFLPSSDGAKLSLIHNVIHHLTGQESLNSASRSTWRWPERRWADELTRNLVFQLKTAPSLKAFKCAARRSSTTATAIILNSSQNHELWTAVKSCQASRFFHFILVQTEVWKWNTHGWYEDAKLAITEPSDKATHSSNFTLCYSVIASKHRKHRRREQPPVPDLAHAAHWALWPMSFLQEVSALTRIIKYSAVLP